MLNAFAKVTKGSVSRSSLLALQHNAVLSTSTRLANSEATFETKYKLHRLENGPSTTLKVTKDNALKYYRLMQTIRRLEASAADLYKQKKARGFCHLYSGQEACAVGIKCAMEKDDAVLTSYRCHAWTYLSTGNPAKVLCELAGKSTGASHGKGGSMHMYGENFYGGNAIVGAQQSLGAGIAFAMKYRNQKNVCLTLYGDGAANQGQLFEVMNMAKLWDLPALFVCENNLYGMGTSAPRSSVVTDYYTRGDYVPGIWVDGMDVLAVHEVTKFGKEWCNAGKGPLVIELYTYRYGGHSMSDPGTSYRSREEVAEVRKTRDPISTFKKKIVSAGLVSEDELKNIDKEVRKEVDAAAKAASTDPIAPVEALYADVYHNTPPFLVRGTTDTFMQPANSTDALFKELGLQ